MMFEIPSVVYHHLMRLYLNSDDISALMCTSNNMLEITTNTKKQVINSICSEFHDMFIDLTSHKYFIEMEEHNMYIIYELHRRLQIQLYEELSIYVDSYDDIFKYIPTYITPFLMVVFTSLPSITEIMFNNVKLYIDLALLPDIIYEDDKFDEDVILINRAERLAKIVALNDATYDMNISEYETEEKELIFSINFDDMIAHIDKYPNINRICNGKVNILKILIAIFLGDINLVEILIDKFMINRLSLVKYSSLYYEPDKYLNMLLYGSYHLHDISEDIKVFFRPNTKILIDIDMTSYSNFIIKLYEEGFFATSDSQIDGIAMLMQMYNLEFTSHLYAAYQIVDKVVNGDLPYLLLIHLLVNAIESLNSNSLIALIDYLFNVCYVLNNVINNLIKRAVELCSTSTCIALLMGHTEDESLIYKFITKLNPNITEILTKIIPITAITTSNHSGLNIYNNKVPWKISNIKVINKKWIN